MTEHERLIMLLKEWGTANTDSVPEDKISDYLLNHGVIVPPCKVGDNVYAVIDGTIQKEEVRAIKCYEAAYRVVTDTNSWNFKNFGEIVYTTPEEAEKAMEREK